MATTVQGEVKYEAQGFKDHGYGPSTNAVFIIDGEEERIWADKGSKEAEALHNLRRGETLTLLRERKKKGKGKWRYSLLDNDVDRLAGEGEAAPSGAAPSGAAPSGAAPSGASAGEAPSGSQTLSEAQIRKKLANVALRHADLTVHIWQHLDQRFDELEEEGKIERAPTNEDLRSMAVSAAIQAFRNT